MCEPGADADGPVAVSLTVNGREVTAHVPADRRLLEFIREDLGLTGTKAGCEVGFCGVCSVIVDGEAMSSCHMLAVQASGRDIVTVEGLAADPVGRALQDAFVCEGGFQCGYCTAGQLVMGTCLIKRHDVGALDDTVVKEQLAGTLCRCTGYYGIVRAIRRAGS